MRKLSALVCAVAMLGGCAGRDPVPVSAFMPNDAALSCSQIESEIVGNNAGLKARVTEDAETEKRNIAAAATAILLFWPAAFAMDLSGAASTEAQALEGRNQTLMGLASEKQCQTSRAMTVAEATVEYEAEIKAAEAAESDARDNAPGVKTPTDQRLHQAPAVGAAVAAEPVSADEAARHQDLMDRFLRGEITKDEYERLRAG